MNEVFLALGIESIKPIVKAVLLPPLPFIVLLVAGGIFCGSRRRLGWTLIAAGALGLWLSCTVAAGKFLLEALLNPPPVLDEPAIAALGGGSATAIVVLGGGLRPLAPEYGTASLKPRGIERLRYGIWLARRTNLPLAFSGGLVPGARPGPSEAATAAIIAEHEFGHPLRWQEGRSRDTRENALRTVELLQPDGIERVVLVTHADHMPRALFNFSRAAGPGIAMVAAPVAVPASENLGATDWLPTPGGFDMTWGVLHEWLGLLAGA